jgi:hypothetical protein
VFAKFRLTVFEGSDDVGVLKLDGDFALEGTVVGTSLDAAGRCLGFLAVLDLETDVSLSTAR